jgi:DNA-directed RNA polymerase specialized sigma24 family protein
MTAPDAANDAAVISRSLHDPEAFALLYDRHAAAIYRYVARRLGDAHADDMVADCFLAAFHTTPPSPAGPSAPAS